MKRRHKRRSKLRKPLYAAVALFPFSLWNFYRHQPGIFYLHLLFTSFIILVFAMAWSLGHRKNKRRPLRLGGGSGYIKNRIGQGSDLRRLWAKQRARGGRMADLEKEIGARLKKMREILKK